MKPKHKNYGKIAHDAFYGSLPWYDKPPMKWKDVPTRYKKAWRNVAKTILKPIK